MALTPDDVVNKRFQPTKFREGYDQDEVDDFLDEVVEELRRLTDENAELRRELAACREGKAQAVPAPVAAAPVQEKVEAPKTEAKPAEVKPVPVAAAAPAPAAAPAGSPADAAAGVLAMAQKLHDEYVAAGAAERDRLVSEAQTKAAGLVKSAEESARKTTQDATEAARKTTTDAEETKRKTLAELERQKTGLEGQIEQLRGFERDYRSRMRTYIQGQLRDLDASKPVSEELDGKNA